MDDDGLGFLSRWLGSPAEEEAKPKTSNRSVFFEQSNTGTAGDDATW
ncbi:hypothetical protein MY4038_004012 [Beauveria bassiana]